MSSIDVELSMNRRNTTRFIQADPQTIVLTPQIRTVEGKVAKFVDGTPRLPQVFKFIMQSAAGGSIEQHTGDGTARRMDFQLLGDWNSQGDVYDHFLLGDTKYKITAIVPDNGYERRFVVEAYGKHSVGG